MPAPPGPPQDPKIQITQLELQADAQKFQAESTRNKELEQLKADAKLQEGRANLELQASNDVRDAERETLTAQHRQELAIKQIEFDRYKVDSDNLTKLLIAQLGHGQPEAENEDPMNAVSQAIAMLVDQMGRPKTVIYDELGRAVGLASNPGIES